MQWKTVWLSLFEAAHRGEEEGPQPPAANCNKSHKQIPHEVEDPHTVGKVQEMEQILGSLGAGGYETGTRLLGLSQGGESGDYME